jgi:large subunit ribosomal protein L21
LLYSGQQALAYRQLLVVFCSAVSILSAHFGNCRLTPKPLFGVIPIPFWNFFMYAVVETGGKQYRVAPGDTLEIERPDSAEPGKSLVLDRVLLVAQDGQCSVGTPTVANASIVADVIENIRGEKKVTFKMKRRKGYHKTIGHRQELTRIKITEIKV